MSRSAKKYKINGQEFTVVPDSAMLPTHKDPQFIAMLEKARAFLEKAGLPKGWEKDLDKVPSPPQPE